MALPPKKSQTAANVDWQNTNKTKSNKAVTATPASTDQVHGAMQALAKNNKKMSKKARKRVAARLKAMSGGK